MTIHIEGLSARQCVFADIIWGMESQAKVHEFISNLPQEESKEAAVVLEMIIAAVYDQNKDVDLAKKVLDKFCK